MDQSHSTGCILPLRDSTNILRCTTNTMNADKRSNNSTNSSDKQRSVVEEAVESLSKHNFNSYQSTNVFNAVNYEFSDFPSLANAIFSDESIQPSHEIATIEESPMYALLNTINERIEKPKVITLSLKCPIEDCETMCEDKYLFNSHMLRWHGIQQHRCMFRGCTRSFAATFELGIHIREEHNDVSEWLCRKCGKVYKLYGSLQKHLNDCHQAGHFACSVNGCTFEAYSNRRQVRLHLSKHKRSQFGKLKFKRSSLNSHNVENPLYRCNWSNCEYTDVQLRNVTEHIIIEHLYGKDRERIKNETIEH